MEYFYGMLWLLVVHFFADFVFQSDWMAQNKSKDNRALGIHVVVYSITLLFGGMGLIFILPFFYNIGGWFLGWVALNSAAHFATDYVTSRINSKLWAAKQVHHFFVSVGFDQLLHYMTLALTMVWLLKV